MLRVRGQQHRSAQRRADALIELAERATATPADAKRPLPLVNVIIDADLNGDSTADMQILVASTDFMTGTDFIL